MAAALLCGHCSFLPSGRATSLAHNFSFLFPLASKSSHVHRVASFQPLPQPFPSVSLHDHLSEEQLRAVETSHTSVRVVAGPGSGKTRVLTYRVVHLISQCAVSPENILFVTFTNKAAQELRERLEQLLGYQITRQLTVGTFHSICSKILRRNPCFGVDKNFVIYDENDSERVLKQILQDAQKNLIMKEDAKAAKVSADGLKEFSLNMEKVAKNVIDKDKQKTKSMSAATLRKLLKIVRTAKLHMMKCFLAKIKQKASPNEPASFHKSHIALMSLYEKKLRKSNAVDFDDLVHLVVQMLHTNHSLREVFQEQWRYILVDEFQDTDLLQYELIRILAMKNQNLFVVGDIDQAIFGWRGADLSYMQWELANDFPSIATFQLKENYRSSSSIVKAASVILKHSSYDRKIGPLRALSPVPMKGYKAVPITIGQFDNANLEARFIVSEMQKLIGHGAATWRSFALLYRTRMQAVELERALLESQIPYQIYGAVPFYSHKEIKILIAYLKLIANFENDVALQYCINVPPRGIGEKSIDILRNWANLNDLTVSSALEKIYSESLSHKQLGLRPKARTAIFSFMEMINQCRKACLEVSVLQLLKMIIEKLSFTSYIEAFSEDEANCKQRLDRIEQFLYIADLQSYHGVGYNALLSFLEDVTLLTNHEEENHDPTSPTNQNKVTLSTMHSSKGLEFDCVFLVGANEGLIPLEESDPDEERRLFYVAITRARKQLFMTHARQPSPWQQAGTTQISRFVEELIRSLPHEYVDLSLLNESRTACTNGKQYQSTVQRWKYNN